MGSRLKTIKSKVQAPFLKKIIPEPQRPAKRQVLASLLETTIFGWNAF